MYRVFALFLLLVSSWAWSVNNEGLIVGQWTDDNLSLITGPKTTGGSFRFTGEFSILREDTYVIDFAQGSLLAYFEWQVSDESGQIIDSQSGGISSSEENHFSFRHGRGLLLKPGNYSIDLLLESPHFIIAPLPYIQNHDDYVREIRSGNILTVFCLGIFFSLACYYLFLFAFRRAVTDLYYALFILGNFIFQGTSQLFFHEVFGLRLFILGALPILFSNIAYILFVSELLRLKQQAPRWFQAGRIFIGILAILAVIGIFKPNLMMEMDRYGVAIFTLFGFSSGIYLSLKGVTVARWYMAANVVFTTLAMLSISATDLSAVPSWHVEHLGLFAVTADVILLAMVLAYQVGDLQRKEKQNYEMAQRALKVSLSDSLTGLPNRRAFNQALSEIGHDQQLTIIDLDGLKLFNDRFGHSKGDELLLRFSELMHSSLGYNGQVYRLGGDEFAVLSLKRKDQQVTDAIHKSIATLQQEGFSGVGASVGSAGVGEEETQALSLMQLADKRMYMNKQFRQSQQAASWQNSI